MKNATQKFPTLVKENTIERIAKVLQDYILQHELQPGMELPAERDMAQQLGVNRFSLREALRVAQTQGLIEIVHGRKPRVAEPTAAAAANVISLTLQRSGNEFLELIEARLGLECQIARLAAQRANPEHLVALQQNLHDMEQQQDDIAACVERDIEFHRLLLTASNNKVFAIMLEPLTLLLRESRAKTMQRDIVRALSGHRKILAAIEKGDAHQSAQAMEEHLHMAEEDLRRNIKTKPKQE
jgi:GntR family transcriptional repressor for pyruvate dehydrogenase complex